MWSLTGRLSDGWQLGHELQLNRIVPIREASDRILGTERGTGWEQNAAEQDKKTVEQGASKSRSMRSKGGRLFSPAHNPEIGGSVHTAVAVAEGAESRKRPFDSPRIPEAKSLQEVRRVSSTT